MRRALSLLVGGLVMLSAAEASAAYHITKIVQVFAGSAAAPNASYVQIQAYSSGQNFLAGHNILVYDAAGTQIGSVPLAMVANGADQANVLIGTSSVMTAFGVAPDFTLPSNLSQAGGKVCFDAIDCFTWGNYTGGDNGTPFAALTADKAATRTTTGGTNAAGLDDGDDTDSSSADFTAQTPAPKNNNGAAATDAGTDASVPPKMDAGETPQDSGVSTKPSPPKPGGGTTADSGAASSGGGGGGDDGGCSLGAHGSSEGWSTSLGLAAAAAIFVLSRRRRDKR